MYRSIASFLNQFSGRKQRRTGRACKPKYELCEPRRLLAGIEFTVSTGEVLIGGTDEADIAQVSQAGDTVTITQQGFETRTFSASEITLITFVGLDGDDFFENQTAIPSSAFGLGGNDTLIGGSGIDRLFGNGGEDIIRGNAGDDFLVAGNGDDNVDAGAGNDLVIGVRGINSIEGGTGDDSIFGGLEDDIITDSSGSNTLVGSTGNDSIRGGSDDDLIFGGPGTDFLSGAGGNDRIYAQAGDDTVSGGTGEDIVSGNDGDDVLQGEQGDDIIVGGSGNDQVNFSGELASYNVFASGPHLRIDDLRGPQFGLEDFVFSNVERFSFGDGFRTPAETLNPTPPPPAGSVREVVTVQPIIASNSDGSNTAEFFGNAQQSADIQRRIDEIFAQANIDIEFLPARRVNDTAINVGSSSGTRPGSDLNRIVSDGDARGIGNPDRRVIDLYFVEVVPGFGDVNDRVANGLAFVGAAGAAVHVGDSLVDSANGRATVASVTAHEIGHNLGLAHVGGTNNLLSQSGSGTELTDSQINTIFSSSLSRPVSTSATLVELDSSGEVISQPTLAPYYAEVRNDSELAIGGCGCGVCAVCTGASI